MTLYFIQATDDNGDSLDLLIRHDEETASIPALVQAWRDCWRGEDNDEEAVTFWNRQYPRRIFRVNAATIGPLPWHDPDGMLEIADFPEW